MIPSIQKLDNGSTIQVICYVATCLMCKFRVWVYSGCVLYYSHNRRWKGGHGYSPGATHCPRCTGSVLATYTATGRGTMQPAPYREQLAYHAAHAMGGEAAVNDMLREVNRASYESFYVRSQPRT